MKKNYFSVGVFLFIGMLLTSASLFAQNRKITGTVTSSEDGSPIPGVGIIVKNTSFGTATDSDGNYALNAPDNATLVFSFLGFTTEEILVGTQTNINVMLVPDFKKLSEVVVVGYGTQKRSDLTGSIATISDKSFNSGQVTTPDQLITGKVAGVQITSAGGAPGGGSIIRIRGGSSLNASNDPLIVIDGVPVDNSELKGSSNALSLINPNDIESFNILKDASATAIYGARASNGVIIITTKKGKSGDKLKVAFSTLGSISKIRNTLDVLSADEFREVVKNNPNVSTANKALVGTANTNWQDIIYQEAFGLDNNLSLSGAYKTLPYRVSVGYLNQDGILKTSNFERKSGAISLTPTLLKDHLKVNLNLKGSITDNRFADQGAIGNAVAFDPTQPVYTENNFGGYSEWTKDGNPNLNAPRNPLSSLEQRDNRGEVKRSIGNLQFDYKFHFLPDLRANLNLGYDIARSKGTDFQPGTMASVYVQDGSVTKYEQSKTNKLLDFYLNYTKDIKAINSKIDITGGYSYQDFLSSSPGIPVLDVEGDTISVPPRVKTQNTLLGFFGRMNYSFMNRYLLTINVRRDGSSRFATGNKWGTFPSIALAWRINEESFLKTSTVLTDLKLRLGYGVTGQQDINTGDYPFLARYELSTPGSQYQFGNQYYYTLRPAGYDINIKWEETRTSNIGLDFGFLNGKITGTLDYYQKKTKDLLAVIDVPAGSNLTNRLLTNVGDMELKGLEAALNFNIINNEKLKWDVGVNATYNTRKITNLSKVKDETSVGYLVGGISGGVGNTIQVHTLGYEPNSFYVYQQVYDSNNKPLEGVYVDRNKDGAIDDRDKYRYKSPNPKGLFGFNTQLAYDKWSFGFVMRGNVGNYVYNNISSGTGVYRNLQYPNYITNLTRSVQSTNFNNNQFFSDYYVENASFLRMETVNLGYNFGEVYNKLTLRLTANVQNAFVITKYTGLDTEIVSVGATPDRNTYGIDNNSYPRPRIFSLGLNLGF